MRVDLHCHSTASDGALSPQALCERALGRSVELLAITDHDTHAGYRLARDWLREAGANMALQLLPAAEYSCVWMGVSIHVVGLGIDVEHPASRAAADYFYTARRQRAQLIGDRLARAGIPGTTDDALALAGDSQIGRPHFARVLVERGVVPNADEAFGRYLGAGKPGDVQAMWPALAEVVGWITGAGGVAVLAHPLKYKMTAAKLKRLLTAFVAAGGEAIEVVSGRQTADGSAQLARLCEVFGLEASVGSDFHAPGPFWSDLGDCGRLPPGCVPVWRRWVATA